MSRGSGEKRDGPPDLKTPSSSRGNVSGTHVRRTPGERQISGIQPFLELRLRERGRSVSRVIAAPLTDGIEPVLETIEVYFALG
jgi:hypothetical protein